MSRTPLRLITGVAAATILAVSSLTPILRADDSDAALRKKALMLNNVTGENPIAGEIRTLMEDPAGTRKLLKVAVKMAKEKNQPFNFNGAAILADVALRLRDLEASRAFYQICAEQAGKLQSAQKLIQAYLGTLSVIELYYAERKYDESIKLSKEFLETLEKKGVSRQFQAAVLRQMIKAMAKQGKTAEAQKLVDGLLKAREDNWRNLEVKAWLQTELKQYDDALRSYESTLEHIATYEALDAKQKTEVADGVRQEIIRVLVQQGKNEEANKRIDALIKPNDNYLANLELKASLHQEAGHMAEAAKFYQEMLERVHKDEKLEPERKKRLEATIRYFLSGVYIDLDQVDKAIAELRTLLAADPNNAGYNNDLGYIMADHNQNLEEAEQLIRKALDLDRKRRKSQGIDADDDKDNAAYLDSLGWVLFKKKKYEEAKKYLQAAVEDQRGQHVEILDHLADVYQALGQKNEAKETLKKALQVDAPTPRDQHRRVIVEKKLKEMQ